MWPIAIIGGLFLFLASMKKDEKSPKDNPKRTEPGDTPAPSKTVEQEIKDIIEEATKTVTDSAPVIASGAGLLTGAGATTVSAGAGAATSAGGGATAGGAAVGAFGVGGTGIAGGTGTLTGGAAVAGAAGIAAGAVAVTAAGALVGGALTGTTEGTIAGAINAPISNTTLAGGQIGRELHRLLGGSGEWNSLSGATAQLVGAATGLIGSVFGVFAALAWVPIWLLTQAITSTVEDISRLASGQEGAKQAFADECRERQSAFEEAIRNNFPEIIEADAKRYSWAMAIGAQNKINDLRRQMWIRMPRGLGVDESYHLQFGLDRGYWYSQDGGTGAQTRSPLPLTQQEMLDLIDTTEVAGDFAFFLAMDIGAENANVMQYVDCMRKPRGFMKSPVEHARWWQERGWFDGNIVEVQGDAILEYAYAFWNWSLSEGRTDESGKKWPPFLLSQAERPFTAPKPRTSSAPMLTIQPQQAVYSGTNLALGGGIRSTRR